MYIQNSKAHSSHVEARPSSNESTKASSVQQPSAAEATNWKVYSSLAHKISLKYPLETTYEERDAHTFNNTVVEFTGKNNLAWSVGINKEYADPEIYPPQASQSLITRRENITLGNKAYIRKEGYFSDPHMATKSYFIWYAYTLNNSTYTIFIDSPSELSEDQKSTMNAVAASFTVK
jgi:hypothetical protein